MKMLILCSLVALMSGCAHISDYNQGCRDGLENWSDLEKKVAEPYCDTLDNAYRLKQKSSRNDRP